MLMKAWAKSLLIRIGFVKCKDSTSAKLPVSEFEKRKEQYLSGIRAEVMKNDIPPSLVPAYCTDKLQPLDLSVNKPFKDEMKTRFQPWYAEEDQKQLTSGTVISDVKIDTRTSILKPASSEHWTSSPLSKA